MEKSMVEQNQESMQNQEISNVNQPATSNPKATVNIYVVKTTDSAENLPKK